MNHSIYKGRPPLPLSQTAVSARRPFPTTLQRAPIGLNLQYSLRSGGTRSGRPTKESSWPPTPCPLTVRIGPMYLTSLHIGADSVPLARWCVAVREFVRGAEPLAGNCSPVAGQR